MIIYYLFNKMSYFQETCWYYTNGYECKYNNCMFSHNYDKCIEAISKKQFTVCAEGINCKQKCNKIHNLEFCKLITQELVKNQKTKLILYKSITIYNLIKLNVFKNITILLHHLMKPYICYMLKIH